MRSATRIALAAFAFVLWAGPAAAQNDVTFQVNMQPYITTCQFNSTTDQVVVRGSINGWDGTAFALTDSNSDGVYTGTFSLPEGGITYKFFSTGTLGYEDATGDRAYTVVAGAQTIPAVDFADGPPVDACSASNINYDLLFAVDMSIQQGRGAFDPATMTVGVVGEFNGWDSANPFVLTEDSFTPGLYTGIREQTLLAPSAGGFKFIIRDAAGTVTWDSVNPAVTPDNSGGSDPNRLIRVTGTEPDTDGNGRRDWAYDNDNNPATPVYFRDQGASEFLPGPATVTFNVDLRSAQRALAATGSLPGGETSISGLWINGPVAGESNEDGGPAGGIGDWAGWGSTLAGITARQLTDPDGDGIYSITLNYSAGATRNLVAKFGVNGGDNESGFGGNHNLPITTGSNTYNLAFGCVRQADGTFIDETGSNPVFNAYDEYLLIRNDLNPPTCVTVVSGGVAGDVMATASEGGPQISGLEIGATYPNPLRNAGRIDLTLDRSMTVAVRVYDVTGRIVATLLDGRQVAAGTTTLDLDTARLASGVYVLRVEADGQVASRRLTVTR